MTATEWLMSNRLPHLVQSLGSTGKGYPDKVVQQVLDALWGKAQGGRSPESLFRTLVERGAEDMLARLAGRHEEETVWGKTPAELEEEVRFFRARLEAIEPDVLYRIWVWVDERTRYADGRRLSDVDDSPIGSPTNIWHVGRAVQFYGVSQVEGWGRTIVERPPFEECLEMLRKKLEMPTLGTVEEEA